MLEPSIRRIIDGATDGAFLKVHVESLPEAARAVREHSPSALLLSPSIAQRHGLLAISNLVAKTPGVTAVAVLGDDWTTSHSALLDLGACGVREVVNLAEREGWNRLRSIIDKHGGECGRVIAREILVAMDDASDDARQFFATIVRVAPVTTTVRALAGVIGIDPNTLMSRFFRASLPAPKRYLSMTRLLYAAWFLAMPKISVAATADALHYSSPQSFGRHVRTTLGITAAEFRRVLPMKAALDHYRARLIDPYRETLKSFRPLAPT
jgi:AraC-like DNA-binding protein